jgi:long-chain acyl-CoA synthetase
MLEDATTAITSALAYGATITVCPDMNDVPAALVDVHPDLFSSSPRVYEKLQVAVESLIEAEPEESRRALKEALDLGLRFSRAEEAGTDGAMDDLARLREQRARGGERFKPLLAKVGLDRLEVVIIGGATVAPELVHFFRGHRDPDAGGVRIDRSDELADSAVRGHRESRRYVTGVATLDPVAVETHIDQRPELAGLAPQQAIGHELIRAEVAAAVERGNARLNSNEQVKEFAIVGLAWEPGNEILTPTMKVRRVVAAEYAEVIESLYSR